MKVNFKSLISLILVIGAIILAVSFLSPGQNNQDKFVYSDLKELFSLGVTVIGDIILLKRDENAPLYFFSSAEDGIKMGGSHSLQRLLSIYDALLEAKDSLNSNANVPLTLMSILTSSKKKGN